MLYKICPVCGFENNANALSCQNCSFELSTVEATQKISHALRIMGNDFALAISKKAILGREGISKEHFQEKSISRKHLKIFIQNNQWFLEDLNSANGTYLNKKQILPLQRYQISDGDQIALANKITFKVYTQKDKDDTIKEQIVDNQTFQEEISLSNKTMHQTIVLPKSTQFLDSSSLTDNSIINEYKVLKHLASGGESDTYLVEKNKEIFVLKFYRLNMLPNFDVVQKIKDITDAHHENLVQIKEYWEDGKKFYEVYEYCENGNLNDFLTHNTQLDFKDKRTLFDFVLQINNGLKILHHNHVLHRDLKPSNILLRKDFSFVLSDFGIAKDMEFSTVLTKNFKGSYRYSAPESLANQFSKKSDYWSFGIIVYELYIGTNPFEQMTINAIFAKLLDANDLTIVHSNIDPQVLVLLHGLLQKDPLKRWGSAEIDNFLNNIQKNLNTPVVESTAEDLVQSNNWEHYGFTPEEQKSWEQHHFSSLQAHQWVQASFQLSDAIPLQKAGIDPEEATYGRTEGLNIHDMVMIKTKIRSLIQVTKAHYGAVNCLDYNDTSTLLASGGNDYSVKIWDELASNQIESFDYHSGYVKAVVFSPDGKIVASASQDKSVKLWDIQQKKLITSLEAHISSVEALAFSSDGKLLVSGAMDTSIIIWDTHTHKKTTTLDENLSGICSLALSHNDKYLASATEDGVIRIWDMGSKQVISSINPDVPSKSFVAFHPSKALLAYASYSAGVKIIDLETQQIIATLDINATAITFSDSGDTIALGRDDGSIILWEHALQDQYTVLKQDTEEYYLQEFDMSNPNLATVLNGDVIEVWSKSQEELISTIKMSTLALNALTFSKNNRYLACAKSDGFLQIWESSLQKNLATIYKHGFHFTELLPWLHKGFYISDAKNWRDAGFNSDNALEWRTNHFLPNEAKEWLKNGFNLQDAQEWKVHKLLPASAQSFQHINLEVHELEQWLDAGFSLSEIQNWYAEGFDIEEATKWKNIDKTPQQANKYRKFDILGYWFAKFF